MGLNKVPAAAIRAIRNCPEVMYGVSWKSLYPYTGTGISSLGSPILFRDKIISDTPLVKRQG
jgi:hypothetical protein